MSGAREAHPPPTRAGGEYVLGVDFGTALSKAVVAARANPLASLRPIALTDSELRRDPLLLPSALLIHDGGVFFSEAALKRADAETEPLTSFKMLLSAEDLAAALRARPRPKLDPSRRFSMGDLVTLYIAHLFARIAQGLSRYPDLPGLEGMHVRITHPLWKQYARNFPVAVSLFETAARIALAFPHEIQSDEGLSVDQAARLLADAQGKPAPIAIEGALLEAVAVAAAYAPGLHGFITVIDVGAGTTDFTGMEISERGPATLVEAACHSLDTGGDALDAIILDEVFRKARARTPAAQALIWRATRPKIAAIKERMFACGSVQLRAGERIVELSREALWRSADAKAFRDTLSRGFEAAASATTQAARAAGAKDIFLVATGGGSRIGFVQALVRDRSPLFSKLAMRSAPSVPEWLTRQHASPDFATVFPQLAVAIGAAVAPSPMVVPTGRFA